MATQSKYQRSGNRSFHSLASISSRDQGQMFARGMGHSLTDFLPQPVEIDLSLARTLPNPGISAFMPSEFGFPPQGLGGMPYLGSSISRIPTISSESQIRGISGAPLDHWYTDNDGPWNPYQKSGTESVIDDRLLSRHTANCNLSYSGQYRHPNTSDAARFALEIPPSDSGYVTRRSMGNTSVFSADIQDRDQDGNSMAAPSPDYPVFSGYNEVLQQHYRRLPSTWSPQTTHPSGPPRLSCPTCHKPVKTQSELKKHDLRHRKPFICQVPRCTRTEGFSTTNDLDRHTRSKHPSAVQKSSSVKKFRCHVPGCKSKDKAWPRLDNFRSHLKRVHGNYLRCEEAFDEMIRRAEFWETTSLALNREVTSMRHCFPVNDYTALPVQESLPNHTMDQSQKSQYPDIVELSDGPVAPDGCQGDSYDSGDASPREQSPQPEESLRTTIQPGEVLKKVPVQMPENGMTLEILLPTNNIDPALKSTTTSTQLPPRVSVQGNLMVQTVMATDATLTEVIQKALAGAKVSDTIEPTQKQNPERSSLPNRKISRQDSSSTGPLTPGFREQDPARVIDILSVDNGKDLEAQRKAQEVLKHIRNLGYTVTKDPTYCPKVQNPGSAASKKSEHKVTCDKCRKFRGRPCELRKHMKRHERPYGCTFSTCHKDFGSKNDWKRHENSQHFHLEAWRCDVERADGVLCAKSFYRRQTFQDHLKKEYQITDKTVLDEKLKACGIGSNCQSQFWCGFCKKLIDLKMQGLAAWNERFDHIDKHFMGREPFTKQSIRDWSPVDADLSKADFVLPFPLGIESGSESNSSNDSNEEKPRQTFPEPRDLPLMKPQPTDQQNKPGIEKITRQEYLVANARKFTATNISKVVQRAPNHTISVALVVMRLFLALIKRLLFRESSWALIYFSAALTLLIVLCYCFHLFLYVVL
ncbi:uncharacterized protein RAG0_14658 [Rhynchosporium agropyri]|uniref:C2H2-type domain-containing protein n=1 Tax=Rhynchosporium agropyri TaxID=914238 RepID=A0A1E1LHR9_9HELO|nr:uncharacterized protein RAG0_14658 [Rhynchosporium agropyri]